MAFGPGALKAVAGIGTVLVCGGAGAAVATDAKPSTAPLHPPANPSAAVDHAAVAASASGLLIPPTPVCQRSSGGGAGATAGTGLVPAVSDPAARAALQQLRAATTAAQRQAILQPLSPDQRMQLTALLRTAQRAGGGAAPSGPCRGAAAGEPGGATDPSMSVTPNVVSAPATAAPVTSTYVS
ncbi:MAG: hypothetical protein E6J14_11500 [Chloroflexi bacterium]|nr:MAG: hypothetical protein E6J14_11500 [Chloroflexota bacterium]